MFESQFKQLFEFEILSYKHHVIVCLDRTLKFARVNIDFLGLEESIVPLAGPIVGLNDDTDVNAALWLSVRAAYARFPIPKQGLVRLLVIHV